MFDNSAQLHFAPCLHRRVIAESHESSDFSERDISEDIQERLLCLECMFYLTETEIRARWNEGWFETSNPQ